MSRSGSEIRASENQSKFIQQRVNKVEQYFGDFCNNFAALSRKLARVRDKGDDVSKSIREYAENESHNHTTQIALIEFSELFAAVQDYRQTEIRRIEDKVIGPLTTYGQSCKHAKERLRAAFNTRDKEIKQKKTLENVKDKTPSDRQKISQAETELKMASVDASRTIKSLEDEMDMFEKKKLSDIKRILMEFVSIEMCFHAKALELYTESFQALNTMSEDEDLEEFRNSMRPASSTSRLEQQRANSKTSLNTTDNSIQRSPMPARSPASHFMSNTITSQTSSVVSNSQQYEDDEDDDEDEEEDEDSDEEEEDDSYEKTFNRK